VRSLKGIVPKKRKPVPIDEIVAAPRRAAVKRFHRSVKKK